MSSENAEQPTRRLNTLLALGILALPAIFAWFLLRSGYSNGLRIAAFAYMACITAAGVAKSFF